MKLYWAVIIPSNGSAPRVVKATSWGSLRSARAATGDVIVPLTVTYPDRPKTVSEIQVDVPEPTVEACEPEVQA